MSSQPSSNPIWRASHRQQRYRVFNRPDSDTEHERRVATLPPSVPSPIAEPQVSTGRKRPLPNIFKSKPFSQMDVQGPKRPAPPGYVPKALHDLEITDLFPESESNIEASQPSPNPSDNPAGRISQPVAIPLEELSITESFLGSNPEPGRPGIGRTRISDQRQSGSQANSAANTPKASTSLPTLPHPAALKQQHILPIYTYASPSSSTTSLTTSEKSLLFRPQSFLSFLAEYTTSFVNRILDVNVSSSSKGFYSLSRNRGDSRSAYNYGEMMERGMGLGVEQQGGRPTTGQGQGQGNQILRYRERQRGCGAC
jgi:hypothetical protein